MEERIYTRMVVEWLYNIGKNKRIKGGMVVEGKNPNRRGTELDNDLKTNIADGSCGRICQISQNRSCSPNKHSVTPKGYKIRRGYEHSRGDRKFYRPNSNLVC